MKKTQFALHAVMKIKLKETTFMDLGWNVQLMVVNTKRSKNKMAIEWLSTNINPPEAGREIIAKNPLKPISYRGSAKQCRVMKFNPNLSQEQIIETMLSENFTLWSYTE